MGFGDASPQCGHGADARMLRQTAHEPGCQGVSAPVNGASMIAHLALPLPQPPVALIGRAAEMIAVRARLEGESVRLLTLTGPPGVGKTLLAHHLAAMLAGTFADGAAFVALEALRDAELVPAAIARALGLR